MLTLISRCRASIALLAGSLLAVSMARADEKPLRQLVNAAVDAGWKKENVTPAARATDAAFLRRVYLDLLGTIPTVDETVAFLDSKEPDKRSKLVDKLLDDPRFAQHQTDVWDQVLFGRNPSGQDTDKREGFQTWLRKQFTENRPYDVWVRELLKAEGNSAENGALYFVQFRNIAEDAGESISRTFMGVQLQCARCHDHPYEAWTQRDFYGLAAFFARLEIVNVGKKGVLPNYVIGEHDSGDVQFTGPAKDQKPGKKGEPIAPKFLQGDKLVEPAAVAPTKENKRFEANKVPAAPKFSRKDNFADWLTQPDNPYFARAVANRVWGQYLGRGLVHPVDNLSPANKPSHPELLAQLTQGLVDHKFDLKWYTRELVNSDAYQMAAAGTGEALPNWFQYARMRPLSAEELVEGWRVATGFAANESATSKNAADSRFQPLGKSYMLQFFGSPAEGTGDFQGGIHEHLYMNNGPLGQMIGVKGGLAEFVGDKTKPIEARVERLFLATLNRRPTGAEQEKFAAFLNAAKSSPTDAVWVLLTSGEFRFNH